MQYEDTARIPLVTRDGSINGYALVDAGDAEWLGQWTWRPAIPHRVGRYAGRYGPYAFRTIRVDGKKRLAFMHRVIMGLSLSHDLDLEVDHINRNPLDNRRSNLRVVTHAQNHQNKTSFIGATSSFRGVYWHKARQKWVAQARLNNKNVHIGCFVSEIEAAEAARCWRLRYMPYTVDPTVVS